MRRILVAVLFVAFILVPLIANQTASAQSGNTWTAYYYPNQDWAGVPAMTDTAPNLAYNWGYGSPGPAIPPDFFTGRYETDVYFYAGTYRFTMTADDEVTLIMGGITYLDTRDQGQAGKTVSVDVTFPAAGTQHVTVYYRELTQTAYLYVDWSLLKNDSGGSGGGWGGGGNVPPPVPPPPPSNCGPQSEASVQTNLGNYTPCIQQGQHQAICFQSDGAWDSPNMGSIQMEPAIEIWGNCTPDSVTSFKVSCDPDVPQQSYKCSKTGAGWFPN